MNVHSSETTCGLSAFRVRGFLRRSCTNAAVLLVRDILGVRNIDYESKTIRFLPPEDVDLDFPQGRVSDGRRVPSVALETTFKQV